MLQRVLGWKMWLSIKLMFGPCSLPERFTKRYESWGHPRHLTAPKIKGSCWASVELERWKDLRGVPLGTCEGVGCRVAEFEGLIENKLFWAKRRGIAVMLKVIWGFYGTQLMLKSSNAVSGSCTSCVPSCLQTEFKIPECACRRRHRWR